MPDETHALEQLKASTVQVACARGSAVGFFFTRNAVITALPELWLPQQTGLQLEIRTHDKRSLKTSAAWAVRPPEPGDYFDRGALTVVVARKETPTWVPLEYAFPQEGDPLLLAGHGELLAGAYSRLRSFDVACLGLQAEVGAAMAGAPILNLRTGGVWGMLLIPRPVSADDTVQFLPFDVMREELTSLERSLAREEVRVPRRIGLGQSADAVTDQPNLLFRLYIPSARLYAAEAARLLDLFREWLVTTTRRGVRQATYRTALGEMIEFLADTGVVDAPSLREQFDDFSSFLTLCSADPQAAVGLLVQAQLDHQTSADLVDKFRRATHRLELDMRHERDRRVLSLRQSLEVELLEQGLDLVALPSGQVASLVNALCPAPRVIVPLSQLAGPQVRGPQVTVQINQQFIKHATGLIAQNVAGNQNLAPQAKTLMSLIDRFGADDAAALRSAVYEFEDPDAPRDERSAAKTRLKRFLGQLGSAAKDVGTDLLAKYLESKGL